eukprot:TRINITY_DN24_c0_g1_i1.p1 TRINITY_DN24_c0_g1~~TRINITY_DN24_c0_g1_i1.p1  ORF type:complete len:265 (-),score=26.25 TRINITY_DN24_c0_g1_i1:77-871(-)
MFRFSIWAFLLIGVVAELDTSPHVATLMSALGARYTLPASAIRRAVLDALDAAVKEADVDIGFVSCDRDFSACPSSWADLGDGLCGAPNGYLGDCPKFLDYRGMSPREKHLLCEDALFPCRGACTQDYGQTCPKGWSSKGKCFSPEGYVGPCVGAKNFENIGIADRKVWGRVCGVEWPCRGSLRELAFADNKTHPAWSSSECVMTFEEDCPAQWLKKEKFCEAPLDASRMRCGYSVNTAGFTTHQKRSWAVTCNVPWPCADSSR